MDQTVALRIAKRFITLPLDKRRLYLEKMLEEGVSPANLPIPAVQGEVPTLPMDCPRTTLEPRLASLSTRTPYKLNVWLPCSTMTSLPNPENGSANATTPSWIA